VRFRQTVGGANGTSGAAWGPAHAGPSNVVGMRARIICFVALFVHLIAGATSAAVYRMMSGDHTTINPDRSATEAGDTFDPVQNGSPAAPWISTEHFAGNYSIGMQVPTDHSGNAQRFEYKILKAAETNGLHFDNARYSGFAFKLASAPAAFTGSSIFWQAWQGSPWGPPVSLKFGSGSSAPYRIRLAIRNASVGPDSSVPDIELWNASLIYPDTWYRVVVYLFPRYDTDGNIKLWINGTNYLDWTGPIGYDPGSVTGAYNGLDIKNGIYQPNSNNTHTLYFDQVIVADSYAEAAAVLPTVSNPALSNGVWRMLVNGDAVPFTIQTSTNLVDWSLLLTTNPPALPFWFEDPTSAGNPCRFYRVGPGP